MTNRIPTVAMIDLLDIAEKLTKSQTEAERAEAVRAFLATCATFGIYLTDGAM
jgi:hypothetical protein